MVVNGFANYDLTYKEFMEQSYVPHYKASVQKSTWSSRECGLIQITEFFGDKKLREINVRDCEIKTLITRETKKLRIKMNTWL